MHRASWFVFACVILTPFVAEGQQPPPITYRDGLSSKLVHQFSNKIDGLNKKVTSKSKKYLRDLLRQEKHLQGKLSLKRDDPTSAGNLDSSISLYNKFISALGDSANSMGVVKDFYNGHLDSMQTALKFFEQADLSKLVTGSNNNLDLLSKQYKAFQLSLNQSETINRFLQERKQFLATRLKELGLTKEYNKLSKTIGYYKAQVQEWKNVFEDPSLLEKKLLQLANKIPAFTKFFNKYSALAGIFRLPGNDPIGGNGPIPGLQTRDMVMQQLEAQLGGGPNMRQYVAQSMAEAKGELDKVKRELKSKEVKAGREEGEAKINSQRVRSFWKRWELNSDLQNTRGSSFLPITTDFALGAGFKASDRFVAGFQLAYKMGWGKDIRHISITHEGVGLRSYLQWQIKGSFHLTAAYERNFRSRFDNVVQLRVEPQNWQTSALAGLVKKYTIGKKWKGDVKFLFDALYRRQIPQGQPLVMRFGYSF